MLSHQRRLSPRVIQDAAAAIPADNVVNACRRFRSCLEAVIEADDGWIQ